jgi:hypothetical protein
VLLNALGALVVSLKLSIPIATGIQESGAGISSVQNLVLLEVEITAYA